MNFRTQIQIDQSQKPIEHTDKISTIGSCFAENIARYLIQLRFYVLDNPFGVLYNPASIYNSLNLILSKKSFTENDLINYDDLWHSWYHHSSFSHQDQDECLSRINNRIQEANVFLKNCNYLIITYGSAYVYEHIESGLIVSNCHKIPSDKFSKYRLNLSQIEKYIQDTANLAKKLNPSIQIIFSVSPIRQLKDGMIENQLSKSSLILGLHNALSDIEYCSYFPAYEILMDDLRDYRFYRSNLTHPNEIAVEYILEKFSETWLSENCQSIIKDIDRINQARSHKLFFPGSSKAQTFIRNQLIYISDLEKKYPYVDFSEDVKYFSSHLKD